MTEVTQIMNAFKQGGPTAVDKLLPLVYEEFRLSAVQKMSQRWPEQTLKSAALINKAYIRLVGVENQHREGYRYFFATAVEARRRKIYRYLNGINVNQDVKI